MRKIRLYYLFLFLGLGLLFACRKGIIPLPGEPTPVPPPLPAEETEAPILTAVHQQITQNILGYYTGVPVHYNETNMSYPLLIYFHGGGQYGKGDSTLVKVLKEGVPKLLNEKRFPPSFSVNGEKFSFIVIAPQLVRAIGNAEMDKLIEFAKSKFRIDTTRIYLAGFSLGARTLSDYTGYEPDQIAAITIMGGMPAIDRNLNAKCKRMANSHLPIWEFHNVDDSAWNYSDAVKFKSTYDSVNPAVPLKFTSFPVGEGKSHHDCWTRTTDPSYREGGKNIYEWMLTYKR